MAAPRVAARTRGRTRAWSRARQSSTSGTQPGPGTAAGRQQSSPLRAKCARTGAWAQAVAACLTCELAVKRERVFAQVAQDGSHHRQRESLQLQHHLPASGSANTKRDSAETLLSLPPNPPTHTCLAAEPGPSRTSSPFDEGGGPVSILCIVVSKSPAERLQTTGRRRARPVACEVGGVRASARTARKREGTPAEHPTLHLRASARRAGPPPTHSRDAHD